MTLHFNLIYLISLLVISPWFIYKAITAGKYRRGMWAKFTGRVAHPFLPVSVQRPTAWFHGVSVGEIHLLRQVIARFRQRHPDWQVVVSTTTDTGYDEAAKCYPDLPVIWWPFDFSWAVNTALDRVQPDLVVLAEGEMWPNFIRLAKRRGVKLAILNGRMSPRSARRFRRVAWLVRGLFRRFDVIAAQTEEYAANYQLLGAKNVVVSGSVKYDGAQSDRHNSRTRQMRELFGIQPDQLVWVAGSTQAPEEEIVLSIYRQAIVTHPNLRLILVPRQKDRFDEVARILEKSGLTFLRRSQLSPAHCPLPTAYCPLLLVDTIGELGAVWGLADVAFVGGSLDGKRGGQNMIEPAAYGAAVVFGPLTWNFKDTVARLLDHGAAVQVQDAEQLSRETLCLLADTAARSKLGQAARSFVASQQGATERTLDALDELLDAQQSARAA